MAETLELLYVSMTHAQNINSNNRGASARNFTVDIDENFIAYEYQFAA